MKCGAHALRTALLAAVLGGCAGNDAQCGLGLATSIPLALVQDDSALAIPATLNGHPLRMLVDTGSERTLLDARVISTAERTYDGGDLTGIGGRRQAEEAVLKKLEIGRLHGQVAALSASLSAGLMDGGYDGQFGMDIMGAYDVDLNLAGGDLRLYSAQPGCAVPRVALAGTLYSVDEVPSDDSDYTPHVKVQVGGQRFNAILDTGADEVVIFGAAARSLGLTGAALDGDPTETTGGIGRHKVTGRIHMLESLTLGDLTMRNVPALVLTENDDPAIDMLLGIDFAKKIHFWISNSTHRLLMQFPPMRSPPLATVN